MKFFLIILVIIPFILSACSSNIFQSKQELGQKKTTQNLQNIDECLKFCADKMKKVDSNIDCSEFCRTNSEPYQRDQRRILDIKQIQTALESYFNDAKQYPPELIIGGSISYKGLSYIRKVPSAPLPADGSCTEDNNIYKYRVVNEPQTGQSYTLTYCLGDDADAGFFGEINGGSHAATPEGIR